MPAELGLDVHADGGAKGIVGQEGGQQKRLNRPKLVLVDVIRVQVVDRLIEPRVLDVSALVAQRHRPFGAYLGRG